MQLQIKQFIGKYFNLLTPFIFSIIIFFVKPPEILDDLLRFYQYSAKFEKLNYTDFFKFLKTLPDFVLPILIFICTKLSISVSFLVAAITFISSYLVLKISSKISTEVNLWFLFGITAAINVAGLLSGVRNFFAVALVFLSVYNFYYRRNFLAAILFYILALLTHFSCIFFVPLFFAGDFRNKEFYKYFAVAFLLCIGSILFIQSHLVIPFSEYFPVSLRAKLLHYCNASGMWHFESVKTLVVVLLLSSWFLPCIVFCFQVLKGSSELKILYKILLVLCLLQIAVFPNYVLFTRLTYLTKIVWVVSFLQMEIWSKKKVIKVTVYLIVLFILQIVLYLEGIFDFINQNNFKFL